MNTPIGRLLFGTLLIMVIAALLLASPVPTPVGAAPTAMTFTVNSAADVPDANPGDGVCETASRNGVCTLRAAIMETNARPGGDTILLQPNTTYLLTRPGLDDTGINGDLDISQTVSIVGSGPNSTIIDGNGQVTGDRVLEVITKTVNITGVSIRNRKTFDHGGGIYNQGILTLASTAVMSNSANGYHTSLGGGPTLTHALLANSPAIDAGAPGSCTDNLGATLTTDQRGAARPVGSACGIGAFEFGATFGKLYLPLVLR